MTRYLFLLLIPVFSFSQSEGMKYADSLKQEIARHANDTAKVSMLNELSYSYQDIDPLLGQEYGKKALALAKKLGFHDGIASAHRCIGMNLTNNGEYEAAVKEYKKGLNNVKSLKIKGQCLRSLGLVTTYMTDYTKALDYDMQALKASEAAKDRKGQAAVLSNIGIIYFELNQFPKAAEYYRKALVINEQMGNLTYLSNNLGNLGNCYNSLKNHKKAIEYYEKAIVINDQMGDLNNKSINLLATAHSYFFLNEFDKVAKYNEESKQINLKTGNQRVLVGNISLTIDVLLKQAEQSDGTSRKKLAGKAIVESERVLELCKTLNDRLGYADNYTRLSTAHELAGNPTEALRAYKQSIVFKDSIFNSDNKETIKNLEDKRAIELRDKQIELNRVKLDVAEREKWLYIGGLVMLVAIGFLLYRQTQNQRRNNEKLVELNEKLDEANQTKAKLFSIIGHDLRSSVSHIYQFLEIQKSHPDAFSEDDKIRHNNRITSAARTLLDTMEDLLIWSKSQMQQFSVQDDVFTIDDVFDVTHELVASELDKKSLRLLADFSQNTIVHTDRNMLEIIVRNLVQNAVKASDENSEIIFGGDITSDSITISISNSGKPLPDDAKAALLGESGLNSRKSGLGLTLIRELCDKVSAEIEVLSEQNQTKITLYLPKK